VDWRRLTTRAIAETIALAGTFRPPRAGLRVLMYHALGSPVIGDERGIFSVPPALFEAHMTILGTLGSTVVTDISRQHASNERLRVVITFDDGYADNLRIAGPVLEHRGYPFTVFAVSEFVRQGMKSFLSPHELRELASRPGVTIGAHGATHIPLTQCDDRILENELLSSKHCLEDITGKPVTTMAYPYGAVDHRVRAAADRAGYTYGFTSHFDINSPSRDPLLMARTSILKADNARVFRQKLRGDWDWYRWRATDPAS